MANGFVVDKKGRPFIDKDPNAVLDYKFNWADYLTAIGDTIQSVQFVVDADSGLSVASSSFTSTSATAWVQGGTLEMTGTLTCRIVTAGGRTDDRSVYLKIKEL